MRRTGLFGGTRVRRTLARGLVGTEAWLLVHLSAGIPEMESARHVTADGSAILEQRDSIVRRRVEQIVGLTEHRRYGQSFPRLRLEGELIRFARQRRPGLVVADRRVEHSARHAALHLLYRRGQRRGVAIFGLGLEAVSAIGLASRLPRV